MRVLVTGGAGFIGANVALSLTELHPGWEIVALDNLRRRGAELNLSRLRGAGIEFVHGDVRMLDDLLEAGPIEAMVECSAEPSVLAGVGGDPDYVIKTNLLGAYNCLELARRRSAYMVFLSTSRVYPVASLCGVALEETESRFELAEQQPYPGVSPQGIAETFPMEGARTLYGSTKLGAELLIDEYRAAFGLRATVNRCGVIAGPWQMGKVDQGVFTFWMLAHHFNRELRYIGFGGSGKQVRDLLHVADLADLVDRQLCDPAGWDGFVGNVGGGRGCSLSLRETTELCAEITGNRPSVTADTSSRPGDVPIYVSDCRRLYGHSEWRPRHGAREILGDIHAWIAEHEPALERAL
jgi:CDP-paratose 2-epimerase